MPPQADAPAIVRRPAPHSVHRVGASTEPQRAGRPRIRTTLGGGIVLVIAALGVAVLVVALTPRGETQEVVQVDAAPFSSGTSPVFVHITGEVQRPGLYELREGDRAVDAVAAAGGFTENAEQSQLNLARFVHDGEQIVVLAKGESGALAPGAGTPGKVNINTADSQALQSLAGVGPALADRILAWRTANGPFASVDDLLNVTGIGSKTLAGFRDSATT